MSTSLWGKKSSPIVPFRVPSMVHNTLCGRPRLVHRHFGRGGHFPAPLGETRIEKGLCRPRTILKAAKANGSTAEASATKRAQREGDQLAAGSEDIADNTKKGGKQKSVGGKAKQRSTATKKKKPESGVLDPQRLKVTRLKDKDRWRQEINSIPDRGTREPRRSRQFNGRIMQAETDPAELEVMGHIQAQAMLDPGNHTGGFDYFCSDDTPQWFAVQVDQPDPSQAGKVAYYLQAAENSLPMFVTTSAGTQIQRKITALNPKKKVTVPGRKAGTTTTKTVVWKGGSYVFFQAIMDRHFMTYLQPLFVEETQFWFTKLKKKPFPPLLTSFVDGFILNEKYFIPRPVNKEMFEEMQEWMDTEEVWSDDQVFAYDEGMTPRSAALPAGIDTAAGRAEQDEEARQAAEAAHAEELARVEELRKLEVEEETRKRLRQRLKAASNLDPGAWNVGVLELKRKKRAHTKAGNKGGQAYFDRTKFAEAAPQTAGRDSRSDNQWRYIEPQRRRQAYEVPRRDDGSQPSQERLAGNDDNVSDSWYSTDAYGKEDREEPDRRMSTRGSRRAAGAVRGSEVAARSGWFPARDDNLGLEEEDDWSFLTDTSGSKETGHQPHKDDEEGPETSGSSNTRPSSQTNYERAASQRQQDRQGADDSQWYTGEQQPSSEATGGYGAGWYEAAAAASTQYSRPREDSSDWYEGGPEDTKPQEAEYEGFDADAWEDWEQEMQKQNQEMYSGKDQWLAPGGDSEDYDSQWSLLNKDNVATDNGAAPPVPDNEQDFEEELLSYQIYGADSKSPRQSSGDLSSISSSQSFDSRSESDTEQRTGRRRGRLSQNKGFSKSRTRTNPLFEWHSSDSSPEQPTLHLGSGVSIEGGRFKGRQGKVVDVRGGVVRVQMEGSEGPVEADMAAAHCAAIS